MNKAILGSRIPYLGKSYYVQVVVEGLGLLSDMSKAKATQSKMQ